MKIVCLVSGGIDSTILLHRLKKDDHELFPLYINYGQKAAKNELEAVKKLCSELALEPIIIDINDLGIITSGLTSNALSSVTNPVFPNRNLILLSIATSYAITKSINVVAIGLIGDTNFPDQSTEFVKQTENVIKFSTGVNIKILAPFLGLNKFEVVGIGKKYHVPLSHTYSCYEGKDEPCGTCLSCKDRKMIEKTDGQL